VSSLIHTYGKLSGFRLKLWTFFSSYSFPNIALAVGKEILGGSPKPNKHTPFFT
jgi:hypothetical protein